MQYGVQMIWSTYKEKEKYKSRQHTNLKLNTWSTKHSEHKFLQRLPPPNFASAKNVNVTRNTVNGANSGNVIKMTVPTQIH